MKVYSYIVTHDTGFAPNPFHGVLTLACCKPLIRRTAQVGDWVIGLSRRSEHVVYAMRVDEAMSFGSYWEDPRFRAKVPNRASAQPAAIRRGDNIYEPCGFQTFRQLPSRHSNRDGTENAESARHDLGGRKVLVSNHFSYFGGAGPELPDSFDFLRAGRGHRCNFSDKELALAVSWADSHAKGVLGRPAMWPDGDDSWRPER